MTTTYRITSPHYVAAIVRDEETIVQAAPILGWTIGKQWETVRNYLTKKGYTIEPLTETPDEEQVRLRGKGFSYLVTHRGSMIVKVEYCDESNHVVEEVGLEDLPKHVQEVIVQYVTEEEGE